MTNSSASPAPRAAGHSTRRAAAAKRAAAGVIAGLAGVGVGQLVAAALEPQAAPILAVGSAVVDLTPQPVKQWAIDSFGTSDKIFLITVIAAVAVVVCAVAGLVARRASRPGSIVLGILGLVCATAALTRPVATLLSVVPSAVTTGVAVYALNRLLLAIRQDASASGAATAVSTHAAPATETPATAPPGAEPGASPATAPSRRAFLRLGGVAAAVGAGTLLAGQWLITTAERAARVVLPRASKPLPPLPAGLEQKIPGITAFQTDATEFYRIDTALTIPRIDPDEWRLEIDGDVDNPIVLTLEQLMEYEVIERDITMTCVSNEVGGQYIGSARWLGVRVSDVLKDAGIKAGVDQILSEDVDGMTISTPVQALTDDREALLAFGMNGEQLPRQHGFPVRLVTPGLYGFVGSTKWVRKLTATTYAERSAYWTDREWVTDAPVLTQARIDVPRALADLDAGEPTFIGGVAWAQGRGISKVEVKVDGEPWRTATLGPEAGIDYWRQWYLEWTPDGGQHTLQVRATDATGTTQTTAKAPPFPSGATGQQTLVVRAS